MSLKDIMLSERRQFQKVSYCIMHFYDILKKAKL